MLQQLQELFFVEVIAESHLAVHEDDRDLILILSSRSLILENVNLAPIKRPLFLQPPQLRLHLIAKATTRLGIDNDLIFGGQT